MHDLVPADEFSEMKNIARYLFERAVDRQTMGDEEDDAEHLEDEIRQEALIVHQTEILDSERDKFECLQLMHQEPLNMHMDEKLTHSLLRELQAQAFEKEVPFKNQDHAFL